MDTWYCRLCREGSQAAGIEKEDEGKRMYYTPSLEELAGHIVDRLRAGKPTCTTEERGWPKLDDLERRVAELYPGGQYTTRRYESPEQLHPSGVFDPAVLLPTTEFAPTVR